MTRLDRVQQHLRLYEHPLIAFEARPRSDSVEVIIWPRFADPPVHTYTFELHPRDLDDPRLEWTPAAPDLRRAAGLRHRDVHPHPATPQGKRTTRTRRQAVSPTGELRERIAEEIRQRGPILFSRYMELCLYEPELGYYSRARERFGKAGDFYTSSDVHAVFGRLLARQFDEMWRALGSPPRLGLIELGPGRGLFARDVLDWSAKQFPEFFRAVRYHLVEQSAHLRAKLQE